MSISHDTGWTMDSFVRWAFGPLPLAHLAVDVDLARRCVGLLSKPSEREKNRGRLALLARRIQTQAGQHFLYEESELAGSLMTVLSARFFEPGQAEEVAHGFEELERRVSGRLAGMAKILNTAVRGGRGR